MRLDNFNLQKKYLFNWSKLDELRTRLRFEFVRFCCLQSVNKNLQIHIPLFFRKKKNTHYRFPINALNAKKYMIFSNQSDPMRETFVRGDPLQAWINSNLCNTLTGLYIITCR